MSIDKKDSFEYLCTYFTNIIKQSDYKHVFYKDIIDDTEYYAGAIDQKILNIADIYNKIKNIQIDSNFETCELYVHTRLSVMRITTNVIEVLAIWRTYIKHYKKGTFTIKVQKKQDRLKLVPIVESVHHMIEIIDQLASFLKEPLYYQTKKRLYIEGKQAEEAYNDLCVLANIIIPDMRFVPGIIRQATKYMKVIFICWNRLENLFEDNFKKYARTVDFSYKSLS